MRMWMADPGTMCRKHLLGEHVELHMLVGCLNRGKRIDGFIKKGLVETKSIRERHAALVEEMCKRGYKHASPLPNFTPVDFGRVDRVKALTDLRERCPECRGKGSDELGTHHRDDGG